MPCELFSYTVSSMLHFKYENEIVNMTVDVTVIHEDLFVKG